MLPVHFPAWQTVYWWFRKLLRRFLFQTIHDIAVMIDRELQGREASPTGCVLDSQTVRAPHAPGGGGYDAGKKTKGRKRLRMASMGRKDTGAGRRPVPRFITPNGMKRSAAGLLVCSWG
jgi:transposase